MNNFYYSAPSDSSFEDMKKACIEVWNTYSNDGGYRDSKINRIKDIKNVSDNFMYMFAMFDINNQRRVAALLKKATKIDVRSRLESGGMHNYQIQSIGL